ncbi:hypothetical protein FEM48_Zijuj11G0030700 [Ziziphus jujuba var. spinosa]|uniref:Tubulin-specific chaperone A n=1 Tax=Ziziphus jujuba var. spinosa TaxID=714518 RepID=A0A978UGG0_ZIZJJ|nr:hypothetical protein FEM48_Zijuj11G0030700 [Ziziphus jujuba var. spinosa]
MATVRSLKIKTSSCKRIVKELHSYEKEVQREAAKTTQMKDDGADPYDLKQQRLETSIADLKATLAELEESNQNEGPEIEEARSTIEELEKLFPTSEDA